LTVMVNKVGVPVQVAAPLVNCGVTVMVAVTGALVVLVAVKAAMSPEPVAASPMEISELTQLYTVPATLPENETPKVEVLWHKTWLGTALTVGMGFTVMVNDVGVPVHVTPEFAKEGVTKMVAVTGVLVVLVAVKAAILPEPVAPRPMDGSELAQLKTVPGTFPENEMAVVETL